MFMSLKTFMKDFLGLDTDKFGALNELSAEKCGWTKVDTNKEDNPEVWVEQDEDGTIWFGF